MLYPQSASLPKAPFLISLTLNWPLVNELYKTNSSVTEMEAKFEESRDEIEALVAKWKDQIQAHFVSLLHDRHKSQSEVPQLVIVICDNDSDSPANISDDLKVLFCADSLFY